MPHERPRWLAHPSSPSQHKRRISHQTSDRSRGTSAEDWRWRLHTTSGVQAPLPFRRGGRTKSNMSCDTNVSKLLLRWASDTYIRCLLPQLLWCMPLHVMFPLPTTSLHLVRPAPCCMYSVLYVLLQTAWSCMPLHRQSPRACTPTTVHSSAP